MVVDERPDLLQLRPDPPPEVVLHDLVQARADGAERHLVARHRVVGIGREADELGGPHDRRAERGVQHGTSEQLAAELGDPGPLVDGVHVAEDARQVVAVRRSRPGSLQVGERRRATSRPSGRNVGEVEDRGGGLVGVDRRRATPAAARRTRAEVGTSRSASVTAPWRFASRSPSAPTTSGTWAYGGAGRPSRSLQQDLAGRRRQQVVAAARPASTPWAASSTTTARL